MRAHELLGQAQYALADRAATRDQDSERSMALTVRIFAAMTGVHLTELQGWQYMVALKLARSARGQCHVDDWIDLAGYAALAGECQLATRALALDATLDLHVPPIPDPIQVVVDRIDPEQDDDEGAPAEPPRNPPATNTGD